MSRTTLERETPPDLEGDIKELDEQFIEDPDPPEEERFIEEPNPLEKAIALGGSLALASQTAEEREQQMDEISGDGKSGYYSGYN
ncbi:MAG: hypothetical protein ACHQT9_04925 [Candidatus Saccharimonadales bacterium]